jgi:hypothetical protein
MTVSLTKAELHEIRNCAGIVLSVSEILRAAEVDHYYLEYATSLG